MASVEVQKNIRSSTHRQSLAVPESQKEHSQSLDTQDRQTSTEVVRKEEGETLIDENVASTVKDRLDAKNCDQPKSENEEEVIILENDKEQVKSNVDKIEHVRTAESLNVTTATEEDDSKTSKNINIKEIITRSGNNFKRKRRNFAGQETDSVLEENSPRSKRKKKNTNDRFCWRCHKESVDAQCSACPRSWHRRCVRMQQSIIQNWICGECAAILKAENAETRSTAMAQLSVDQLCLLLRHVVERMREYPGSEPFWKPVETSEAPNYSDYVVKPMDLSLLESNVRAKLYGSTDAFMADAKWIQHNCIVFNTCGGVYADTSKLTNAAKQIIKLARQEVSEIEACPDCYAHGRNIPRPQPSWFIEPCRRPHPLVWAKLKGFPFWPAKAMPRTNSQGFVDVRFFGEHDRAWVSPRDLYLYSEDPPVPLPRKRKLDMEECVREITRHCRKLELVFGQFKFAPPKVQYNPHDPMQIKLMLPNYDPLRSNSYISSQFLIPKKKQFFKKRLHVKTKTTQSDSERMTDTSSDIEQKALAADVDENTEQKKTDDDVSTINKKTHESDKLNNVEMVPGGNSDSPNSCTNANRTANQENKERIEIVDKKESKSLPSPPLTTTTKLKTGMKEDVKPSTSKLNASDDAKEEGNTVKQNSNGSNVITLEQNNNSEKVTKDHAKSVENLSKKLVTSSLNDDNDVQPFKQESTFKPNVNNKGDFGQSSLNSLRNNMKVNKSVVKVYKPKTRIVDKMNAERALKSIEIAEKVKEEEKERAKAKAKEKGRENENEKEKEEKSTEGMELKELIKGSRDTTSSLKDASMNSMNNNSISSVASVAKNRLERVDPNNDDDLVNKTASSTDQEAGGGLLLVVNNDTVSALQKSMIDKNSQTIDNDKGVNDVSSTGNQASKCLPRASHQKKESRARKSFPNKSRSCPQLIPHSSASALSNSIDSMVYNIPVVRPAENSIGYQMLPPEAGPISAHLYHGAQDLARRMARLMEEAYKEAAQENQNCESAAVTSENHQATVHFLRLQIERMRWEHQQQLAELKHNTDRVLREMKAGLEAERLRAIEETRREAEEEKLRCIEEIKRKQWCAMCGREALFYCCWNTAYCDYPCQQSHWPMHMRTCAQKPSFTTIVTNSTANSNQQQQLQLQQQQQQQQQQQHQQQQQQQQNHNIKVSSSVGRIYALTHNKLNEISGSLPLSYSKEDNGTSL